MTGDTDAKASSRLPADSEHESVHAALDGRVVFNVVWTGDVFRYLRFFVCSLIDQSDAQFRFVANACSSDALALMHEYAGARSDRIAEVLEVSEIEMITHGAALDAVHQSRNDGEFFCFVDADIKANGPFLPAFRHLLENHSAVTSGKEVWTDDNVVPADHVGVGLGGRHFFDAEGFVYGCPHFAMYHRDALDDTTTRWGVGFGSGGPAGISEEATERLDAVGHLYKMYDTGKIVNILLQADGYGLVHEELPQLLHIGGLSHYVSPPESDGRRGRDGDPTWTTLKGMAPRAEVTRFAASMLRDLSEGRPAPSVPPGLDSQLNETLERVRSEMIDLVNTHFRCLGLVATEAASSRPTGSL